MEIDRIDQKRPDVVLLSGGGNDIAGEEFFSFVNNAQSNLANPNQDVLDGVIHFFMDRLKAGPKYLGRFKNFSSKEYLNEIKPVLYIMGMTPEIRMRLKSNRFFWISLEIDQAVHHLTHYAIIVIVTVKHYSLY